MRKHSPRKWLHAILDLLPVILIPVFMIYSHRHTLTERTEVDIQYKYQSNDVDSIDDIVEGNIYYIDELDFNREIVNDLADYNIAFYIYKSDSVDYTMSLPGFDEVLFGAIDYELVQFTVSGGAGYLYIYTDFDNDNYFSLPIDFLLVDDYMNFYNVVFMPLDNYVEYFDYLDVLPQYTDYNEIESVEVQDINDNIMSVFAKDLSNTVDNYFNMNEVFNLGDVWTWINTNLFGGTAPLIAKTIWNIIVYEFVIDLLFVFYSFFMFLIDFVDNLLEKPFNKGR